jgi:hypothetical protein
MQRIFLLHHGISGGVVDDGDVDLFFAMAHEELPG